MFLYFFKILDNLNQQVLKSMSGQMQNLALLKGQSEVYEKAESDLQKLTQESIQPEEFFSRDITLVYEIETLENLSAELNVQMVLAGVSGTVQTAPIANTKTPMAEIPYSITVSGSLQQVTAFIESLENLSFVTNITSFGLSSEGQGNVGANLGANFYLLK
jgi:Tfp pilus assembly protein PilO